MRKERCSRVFRLLCLVCALALGAALPLPADVRLPRVLADNMVLQRDKPIPVWGWGEPGEEVAVTLAEQTVKTKAGEDGRWVVQMPAMEAGGPLTMTVVGQNTVECKNVMVGEVWVCSGQSNMAMTVSSSAEAARERAEGDHPHIRMFTTGRKTAFQPARDGGGVWSVCTPGTVGAFSAAGYFFGRKIHRELDVPVGLINSSWGGTRIEPWTPPAALRRYGIAKEGLARLDQAVEQLAKPSPNHLATIAAARKSRADLRAMEADKALAEKMADPQLDDAEWKTMKIPGRWDASGLPGFDGLVWFRKTVEVPEEWVGKDLGLRLCPIDEVDVTWFNGTKVGARGSYARNDVLNYWDVPRSYVVPGMLVKPGRNVIAVRVIDTTAAGGLWSQKPVKMLLEPVAGEDEEPIPLDGQWRYKVGVKLLPMPATLNEARSPRVPTALYNGMIHPLLPFAIRGAIWYQGESNMADGPLYTKKMRALIEGWREVWGQGEFPFYFVQLAPYRYGGTALARLWQAQTDALAIPNTGMAVTVDVGNYRDIHPRRKQEVGQRLALWALAKTYGRKNIVYSGPLYKSMAVEGGKARVSFDHVGGGLALRDGKPLSWFEVAGEDMQFVKAQAQIDGDTVVVSAPEVAKPAAVRYGWAQETDLRLANKEGLPASAFSTEPQ